MLITGFRLGILAVTFYFSLQMYSSDYFFQSFSLLQYFQKPFPHRHFAHMWITGHSLSSVFYVMIIPYRKATEMKKEIDHPKLLRLQEERIKLLETVISAQEEELSLLRELVKQLEEKTGVQEEYIAKLHGLLRDPGPSKDED